MMSLATALLALVALISIQESAAPCFSYQFECNNGRCISNDFVCSGINGCGDNSDEEDCPPCLPSQFECNNGKCISNDFVCNGINGCGDNSDEEDCLHCPLSQFECDDGRCVPESCTCDNDCEDGGLNSGFIGGIVGGVLLAVFIPSYVLAFNICLRRAFMAHSQSLCRGQTAHVGTATPVIAPVVVSTAGTDPTGSYNYSKHEAPPPYPGSPHQSQPHLDYPPHEACSLQETTAGNPPPAYSPPASPPPPYPSPENYPPQVG